MKKIRDNINTDASFDPLMQKQEGLSKGEHTPGPWKVEIRGSLASILTTNSPFIYVASVSIYDNVINETTGKANAELIASVPQLKKELEAMYALNREGWGKVEYYEKKADSLKAENEALKAANKELYEAAQSVMESWNLSLHGEIEEYKDSTIHGDSFQYWSPAGAIVKSEAIANLRKALNNNPIK